MVLLSCSNSRFVKSGAYSWRNDCYSLCLLCMWYCLVSLCLIYSSAAEPILYNVYYRPLWCSFLPFVWWWTKPWSPMSCSRTYYQTCQLALVSVGTAGATSGGIAQSHNVHLLHNIIYLANWTQNKWYRLSQRM